MTAERKLDMVGDEPISIDDLKDEAPWWPFSAWWTRKLIREKQLGAVRIGRRVFATRTLLAEFIQSRVVRP